MTENWLNRDFLSHVQVTFLVDVIYIYISLSLCLFFFLGGGCFGGGRKETSEEVAWGWSVLIEDRGKGGVCLSEEEVGGGGQGAVWMSVG